MNNSSNNNFNEKDNNKHHQKILNRNKKVKTLQWNMVLCIYLNKTLNKIIK